MIKTENTEKSISGNENVDYTLMLIMAKLDDLTAENKDLKSQIKLVESQVYSLNKTVSSLSNEIKSVKEENDEMKSHLSEISSSAPYLSTTISKIDLYLSGLHSPQLPLEFRLQTKSCSLHLYDLSTKEYRCVGVSGSDDHYPYMYGAMIMTGGRMYICGGYDINGQRLNRTYQIERMHFLRKSDMTFKKSAHGLCQILNDYIYSIGGYDGVSQRSFCEKYQISSNVWSEIHNLNEKKHRVACCSHLDRMIYVFGGFIGTKSTKTIEKYDTSKELSGWRIVQVIATQEWIERCEANAIQISQNQILIFGGISTNDSFIFNPVQNTLDVTKKLEKNADFGNHFSPPFVFETEVYSIDQENYLHIYSIPEKKWKLLKPEEWMISKE